MGPKVTIILSENMSQLVRSRLLLSALRGLMTSTYSANFSINTLRFARRSASVRPPHSFKYGVQNENLNQNLNIDKNYIPKAKESSTDENKISSRRKKESETSTHGHEVQKVKKDKVGVNFDEKFMYIKKEKSNLEKSQVSKDGKDSFVSYDLMKLKNERKVGETKELLRKSHKKINKLGYKDDIVFGIHPVLLALQSKRRNVYEIFYKKKTENANKKIHEIIQLAHEMEIRVTASTKKDIDNIVGGDRVHQGVCCHASVLPSAVIDDPEQNYILENIEQKMIHNENESYTKLMSKTLNEKNAIENAIRNKCIFDGNLQINKIDSDINKDQDYSMLKHSDLLEKSGGLVNMSEDLVKKSSELVKKSEELRKSNHNSLSHDSSVEMRTVCSSSESNSPQVWIYLDSVHDPMNLGAILRSSYFLGIDKVIVSQENSCRISGVVSKASAGVAEIIQVYQVMDPKKLIENLKAGGWCTV